MKTLEWTPALSLGLEEMDRTHEEFVALLGVVQGCTDDEIALAWQKLIDHTQQHFAQENHWMQSTGFSSANCHSTQHEVVLQVMREGLIKPQGERAGVLRFMAGELAGWFPAHAQSMDAPLALHLRRVGYDPRSGSIRLQQYLPLEPITSCGGSCVGDQDVAIEGGLSIEDAQAPVAAA